MKPKRCDFALEAKDFRKGTRRIEVVVGSCNELSPQLALGATSEVVEVLGTTATSCAIESEIGSCGWK